MCFFSGVVSMPSRKPSKKTNSQKKAKANRMNGYCERKREAEAERDRSARKDSWCGHPRACFECSPVANSIRGYLKILFTYGSDGRAVKRDYAFSAHLRNCWMRLGCNIMIMKHRVGRISGSFTTTPTYIVFAWTYQSYGGNQHQRKKLCMLWRMPMTGYCVGRPSHHRSQRGQLCIQQSCQ